MIQKPSHGDPNRLTSRFKLDHGIILQLRQNSLSKNDS